MWALRWPRLLCSSWWLVALLRMRDQVPCQNVRQRHRRGVPAPGPFASAIATTASATDATRSTHLPIASRAARATWSTTITTITLALACVSSLATTLLLRDGRCRQSFQRLLR